MRLHRNLGHPTNLELVKLLRQKGASEVLINTAMDYRCDFFFLRFGRSH